MFIRETMVSCVSPRAHTSDYRQKLCAFVPFNRPNRPRAQELKPIKPLGTPVRTASLTSETEAKSHRDGTNAVEKL